MIGLLVAGAIAAWVPDSFWRAFFFPGHPLAEKLRGPLIGPVVAVISFVCSIGNVPLAVVLRKAGPASARCDRVHLHGPDHRAGPEHLPQVLRAKMAAFLHGSFFAAMAAAGYVIELLFGGLG